MNELIRGLPAFAGLVMLAAAIVALALESGAELGARALAREPDPGHLPEARSLHIMHLALLTVAAALAATAVGWWSYPTVAGLVRVFLVTLLVWAVGDLAPRLLASLAPELVPYARLVALRVLPLFQPLLLLAARVDRGNDAPDVPSPARNGAVNPAEMTQGVFSLQAMSVSEVMTPRIDIVSVDVAASEEDVIATLRRSEHARLVVFDGHPDAVAGIVHARDFLPRLHHEHADGQWQSLIRPAAFVPEAKRLDKQLRDFQRGHGHVAIVVDEFGGTAGLVTLEDVLEQIVGEIQDEYDVDEVAPLQRLDDGRYAVQGGVALADLEAELGHDFGREQIATVGGLVVAEFGRVPRAGEECVIDGWRFAVESVARRRVGRVLITAPVEEPEEAAE